jgi:hypothetical protein
MQMAEARSELWLSRPWRTQNDSSFWRSVPWRFGGLRCEAPGSNPILERVELFVGRRRDNFGGFRASSQSHRLHHANSLRASASRIAYSASCTVDDWARRTLAPSINTEWSNGTHRQDCPISSRTQGEVATRGRRCPRDYTGTPLEHRKQQISPVSRPAHTLPRALGH